MLELYHNGLSTCSQKVRMVLCYKGLDWESHPIDLLSGENFSPEYVKINPKAQVPVLIHDGRKIFESTVINEYLDDAFPSPALKPEVPSDRARMRLLTKSIDEVIHTAVGVMTLASVLRAPLLQRPRDEVLADIEKVTNPQYRKLMLSTYEHGIEAPEVLPVVDSIQNFIKGLVKSLDNQEWLAGPDFSLADAAVTPYILRLQHLELGFLWSSSEFAPLNEWFKRVKRQRAFEEAIVKHIPPAALQMFAQAAKPVADRLKQILGWSGS